MRLLSIGSIPLLLLLLAPRPKAETHLKQLEQVDIVIEDLDKPALDIGLSREVLESQALVGLKRDLPKLKVSKGAIPFVYVDILAVESAPNTAAVAIRLEIRRPVMILNDGASSEVARNLATVWRKNVLLSGPKYNMATRVRETLSDLTTELAADYYRQNAQ